MTLFPHGFRPKLVPTLFTIPAVIVMLGLAGWQLERRAWKLDLIETRRARVAAEIVELPARPDLKAFEYRRVRVRGRYRHDKELYLGARSLRGNAGYHIITPLTLAGGGTVLVNRGWVPLRRKLPARRTKGQVAGPVALVGHLRLSARKGWLLPDNMPERNFWFTVDVPAMAKHAGLKTARPFYLQAAGAPPPGGWPRPAPVRVRIPNDHLQYAITWFLLAMALGAIYMLYHRRPRPD